MRASRRWFAVAFGLLGAAAAAEVVDRIAATVNDSAIPESELRRAMVVSAIERLPDESEEAYRGRVLDALIEERLEYDDAQRFGLGAPDAAEIGKAMASLRERLRAAGKDPDAEFAAAGMSVDEVRASIERQLVIAAYVRERFAPVSYADEEQAREEYDKRYVPEEKAAGRTPAPYEQVAAEMRRRYSVRAFDEQVARWLKDLRQKARISIFRLPTTVSADRTPVVLFAAPTPVGTPAR
jgi:hypothetical protein